MKHRERGQEATERQVGRWLRLWWLRRGNAARLSEANARQFCQDVAMGWPDGLDAE